MRNSDFDLVMERILAIDDRLTLEALMPASKRFKDDRESLVKILERITAPEMGDYFLLMLIDGMRLHQKIPTQAQEWKLRMERAIVEVEYLRLPSVALLQAHKIPTDERGVYFIRSKRGKFLYVGSSIQLGKRITTRNHSAIKAIPLGTQRTCTVEWYLYPYDNLRQLETYFIKKCKPSLNVFSHPDKPRKKTA